LVLLENIFNSFQPLFMFLFFKKLASTVSHMTVALRIMRTSRRSSLVINDYLQVDQVGRSYSSDRRKFEEMVEIIQ
jgi:hypothetical protein